MNRLHIEKLVVSGGGHKATVIDFKPRLNFILGPSNTGKSLVMDCLDYMFGFSPKKNRPSKIVDNSYGYERITLHLATDKGTVILERKISEAKKKALIGYIQEKVEEFTTRREKLEETLASFNITDTRSSVEQFRKEIAKLQAQLDAATKESQQIMSQIYEWNGKLSESRTVGRKEGCNRHTDYSTAAAAIILFRGET